MRQCLATLVSSTALLGGCSLVYNPSNLPPPPVEAGIDSMRDSVVILDADPAALALTGVYPTEILEGQGTGGSRPALLVIHGMQLVPGATVAVTAHDAGPAPLITVDNTKAEVSQTGYELVVPITAEIDPAQGMGSSIRLSVKVTQMTSTGPVTVAVPDDVTLTLTHLDELTTASITNDQLAPGTYVYSKVQLDNGLGASSNTGPLVIRSVSSINVTGIVNVSAVGTLAGPGGGGGGAGGPGGLTPANGGPGMGAGGGKPSGGGGGFGTVGGNGGGMGGLVSGDESITTLAAPNRSSGGAGGNGVLTNPAAGSGGGGGGSIEFTAGGDLNIAMINANGGDGADASTNDGGGGSGGLVLLRGLHSATVASITAKGGNAPAGGTGGAGGDGRVRIDSPGAVAAMPAPYRGPMFVVATPTVTRNEKPPILVVGQPLKQFSYYFNDEKRNIHGPFTLTMGDAGMQTLIPAMPLEAGSNQFCLLVNGAVLSDQRAEAANCIEIVYLYTQ